ncbi:hypothetical protein KAW65_00750 [candidate division WOR-3 bacterium]|nr:hypothetical protein [candidate division WOR-3 bacterium]
MKKVLLLSVAALFIASAGFATDTRVKTMGGIGDFLIDDSNIYAYPAWVNGYTGYAFGELDVNPGAAPTLGAFFNTRFGNLGLALQKSEFPPLVTTAIINSGAFFDWSMLLQPKLEFIYGNTFGTLDFGIGLEFAGDAYSKEYPRGDTLKVTESMGILGVNTGVKYTLGEGSWVDFALNVSKNTWSCEHYGWNAVKSTWNDQGKFFINVRTRAFIPFGDVTLIPILSYNMGDASWEKAVAGTPGDTTSEELKSTNLRTGVGFSCNPVENATVIFGTVIAMYNESKTPADTLFDKTEMAITTLPGIVFGAEAQIWNWLTGRVSFHKYLYSRKTKTIDQMGVYKDKETIVKDFWTDFAFAVGASAEVGNFTFDVWVPNGFFFDGPWFFSGNANNATQVSATYHFGK